MNQVKIDSSSFDKFKRRIIKYLRYGLNDTQTSIEASAAGTDSSPIKDMVALYAQTSGTGESYIIGYLVKDKLAEPGEYRIFSTDDSGVLKTYIWLKNDGKIQLGGTADNAVRFKPVDQFSNDLKTFLIAEFAKIATGIATGGGSYVPGTPTFSVSTAKIDEILTP